MRAIDACQLVLLAAIWGASFLCIRVAADEFGVVALIASRLLIGAVVLLPLLSLARWRAARPMLGRLALLGLINSAIPFCLLAYTTQQLSAGLPSIINATVPFFAAGGAWLVLGERPRTGQALGLGLGFVGVVVLVLPKLLAGASDGGASWAGPTTALAIIAGLLAASLYGSSAIYTRARLAGVEPLTIATISTTLAALVMLPAGLATLPDRWPSGRALLAALVLGAVCTGVAYVLFYRLFARIGATRTVAVTFLIPVFGVLWGALFLHERVTWNMLAGGGLILLGMSLLAGWWRGAGWPKGKVA